MVRRRLSLATLVLLPLFSGCVAALLPLAAVGALGKNQIDRTKAKRELVASGAIDLAMPVGSVTVGPDREAEVAGPTRLPRVGLMGKPLTIFHGFSSRSVRMFRPMPDLRLMPCSNQPCWKRERA